MGVRSGAELARATSLAEETAPVGGDTAAWRETATDAGDLRGGELSGWRQLRERGDDRSAES